MATLTEQVAANENELIHLRLKSDNDDKTIALLKQQNAEQALEILNIRNKYDAEISGMRQERDSAVRKASDVTGLIESMGKFAIDGIRKMRGDDTPLAIEPPVGMLQITDNRLPNGADAWAVK